MPTTLITLIGFALIAVALWGLVVGKIIAGSKGVKSNYYYKSSHPFLYYSFIVIYLLIGIFLLYNSF